MKIPEGFTPRGDSNEQPPETYDKAVEYVTNQSLAWGVAPECSKKHPAPWKVPDGPLRVIAYKLLP